MDENSSSFDEQLLEAYRLTRYCLDQPHLFLQIDAFHSALDKFLETSQFGSWAYLTAYNPQSQLLSLAENKIRHQELYQLLKKSAYAFGSGRTEAIKGDWPPEESFIIWNIPKEHAHQLAQKFEQHAFLYGERNGLAHLEFV